MNDDMDSKGVLTDTVGCGTGVYHVASYTNIAYHKLLGCGQCYHATRCVLFAPDVAPVGKTVGVAEQSDHRANLCSDLLL